MMHRRVETLEGSTSNLEQKIQGLGHSVTQQLDQVKGDVGKMEKHIYDKCVRVCVRSATHVEQQLQEQQEEVKAIVVAVSRLQAEVAQVAGLKKELEQFTSQFRHEALSEIRNMKGGVLHEVEWRMRELAEDAKKLGGHEESAEYRRWLERDLRGAMHHVMEREVARQVENFLQTDTIRHVERRLEASRFGLRLNEVEKAVKGINEVGVQIGRADQFVLRLRAIEIEMAKWGGKWQDATQKSEELKQAVLTKVGKEFREQRELNQALAARVEKVKKEV